MNHSSSSPGLDSEGNAPPRVHPVPLMVAGMYSSAGDGSNAPGPLMVACEASSVGGGQKSDVVV